MKRTIMTYGGYFERFMMTLNVGERRKIDYILSLLENEDRLPVRFIKHIRDGLYELRMAYSGKIYRIFFVFDEDCIVVLFNGLNKKTRKTPASEIEKALRIMNEYHDDKRSQAEKL